MKITQYLVGRKVRSTEWSKEIVPWGPSWIEVLYVGQTRFFGRTNHGEETDLICDSKWELVEEPKLPSERIQEILDNYPLEMNFLVSKSNAIIQFLDEQFREAQKK